jgi:hypothetical protein
LCIYWFVDRNKWNDIDTADTQLFLKLLFIRGYGIVLMCHNGRVLGEEADLKAESFSLAQMPIESTNVQYSTKPAFLPNTCYTQAIY